MHRCCQLCHTQSFAEIFPDVRQRSINLQIRMHRLQSLPIALCRAHKPDQLPAPGDLRAEATNNEGEIELRCKTVAGASSYEWQCRLHTGSPPWEAVKTGTTVKILVSNLTPGTVYAFRVRAIGSAGAGTWSDEATERAP